jgi:hypothetical protein
MSVTESTRRGTLVLTALAGAVAALLVLAGVVPALPALLTQVGAAGVAAAIGLLRRFRWVLRLSAIALASGFATLLVSTRFREFSTQFDAVAEWISLGIAVVLGCLPLGYYAVTGVWVGWFGPRRDRQE